LRSCPVPRAPCPVSRVAAWSGEWGVRSPANGKGKAWVWASMGEEPRSRGAKEGR
jgi:hypothetical protein